MCCRIMHNAGRQIYLRIGLSDFTVLLADFTFDIARDPWKFMFGIRGPPRDMAVSCNASLEVC